MKISVQLRDSNLITGSSDRLRLSLGGYYQIKNSTFDTTGLQRTLDYTPPDEAGTPSEDFGFDAEPVIDTIQTAMISAVVANTELATTISPESMFPYYTIPMSIIGVGPSPAPGEAHALTDDAIILNSDEKWKKYIMGGTFNEVEYPGVYQVGTYNVNNLSFSAPYELLSVKAIDEENQSSYETIESKSVYNMYLPQYQSQIAANEEATLLNIYDLLYCSVYSQYEVFADVKERITLSELYNHDVDSVFASLEQEVPALIKTANETPETTPTDTRKYVDSYQPIREYYYSLALSGAFGAIGGVNNALFNKKAVSDLFGLAHTYGDGDNSAFYPFYNKIGLPTFDGGPLNSLIVTQEFDDLLLKSINDIFVAGVYETAENGFVQAAEFNSLNGDGNLYEAHTTDNISLKYVDFKRVLAGITNNPAVATVATDCRFIGEANYAKRAILDNNTVMAHINKKTATHMLDGIQKGLLSVDPVGTLPSEITPDSYMPWSNLDNFKINDFLSMADGDLNNRAECVALRINKRNVVSGRESNIIIQNQPSIANSDGYFSADDVDREQWSYYDTQVKYGETYEYTTHAYFMVVGYQYKYSDLTLSRRISEYGQYDESNIRADSGPYTEFTCIEFYDPSTGQTKPSPMRTSDSRLLEPMRINLLNEAENVGYATAAQELVAGSHINYADFNISIEPTIKIFEYSFAPKQLTVLDNPPPKIDVQPYQVKDQSQRIGFFIKLESPPVKETLTRSESYPTPKNITEEMNYAKYLTSQNMLSTDNLKFGTVSRPAIVEIYRLSAKPTAISDFDGNLAATKSLIISDKNNENSRTYITPTCFYEERVATGHKFYYAFRFLNENNVPSPWSNIIEAELIDDGGYKYSNFNTIIESELATGVEYDSPSTQFKKLLMLRPAIPQIDFNLADLDFNENSEDQYTTAEIGNTLSDNLWNKKYKIRLTSKKTGKKIDLNVNYKLLEDA